MSGLAIGMLGEFSTQVRNLAGRIACELSAEHLALLDIAKNEGRGISTQRIRHWPGLTALGTLLDLDVPSFFSTGLVISPWAHGSRIPTRARRAETTPSQMSMRTSFFYFQQTRGSANKMSKARARTSFVLRGLASKVWACFESPGLRCFPVLVLGQRRAPSF